MWYQYPRHQIYILYMLLHFDKITKDLVLNKEAYFDLYMYNLVMRNMTLWSKQRKSRVQG